MPLWTRSVEYKFDIKNTTFTNSGIAARPLGRVEKKAVCILNSLITTTRTYTENII